MLVHYRACGDTGSTNQNWWGAKLLPNGWLDLSMDVCISITYWVHSTSVCALTAGRTRLWLAQPPPPSPDTIPLIHPLIHDTHDITEVVKYNLKNLQLILCSRVSYETLRKYKAALLIQQIWCGYNVTQENPVASILQNGSYFSKCKMWPFGPFLNPATCI